MKSFYIKNKEIIVKKQHKLFVGCGWQLEFQTKESLEKREQGLDFYVILSFPDKQHAREWIPGSIFSWKKEGIKSRLAVL